MTFEEFLVFRNVKIKNSDHKRIVKLFYVYLQSVTGNKRLLPDLLGRILNIDLSETLVKTGCFNGIFDDTKPPYDNVDFFVRFDNDVRVYIYGSITDKEKKELNNNEYILFILSDALNGNIERNADRYIYIT
jgi:hypothetical protein